MREKNFYSPTIMIAQAPTNNWSKVLSFVAYVTTDHFAVAAWTTSALQLLKPRFRGNVLKIGR